MPSLFDNSSYLYFVFCSTVFNSPLFAIVSILYNDVVLTVMVFFSVLERVSDVRRYCLLMSAIIYRSRHQITLSWYLRKYLRALPRPWRVLALPPLPQPLSPTRGSDILARRLYLRCVGVASMGGRRQPGVVEITWCD